MNLTFCKEMVALFERDYPKVWGVTCPRRYSTPPGYLSPSYFSGMASAELLLARDSITNPSRHIGKTEVDVILTCWKLLECSMPTYFVAEDFIFDLANSLPPADMRLDELEWPFDALTFVLPEKFYTSAFSRPVPFISVAKVNGGPQRPPSVLKDVIALPIAGIDTAVNEVGMFTWANVFIDGMPVDYSSSFKLTDTVGDMMRASAFNGFEASSENDPTEAEDMALIKKAQALGVLLLMAMNAMPEHIEGLSVSRPAREKRGKLVRDALWSPRILGRSYVSHARRASLGGTHASPIVHPRRGHWRMQPYGPKNSLRRPKFIP